MVFEEEWRWDRLLGFSLVSLYLGRSIAFLQDHSLHPNTESIVGLTLAVLGLVGVLFYKTIKKGVLGVLLVGLPLYIFYHAVETAFFVQGIQWAYVPEYALQITLPLLLILHVFQLLDHRKSLRVLLIATSLTFFGHGVLALGLNHAVPGNFIGMTASFFQCSHQTAVRLLLVWGILDMFVVLCFFVRPLRKYALIYAFFWGCITATARVIAFWHSGFTESVLLNSGGMIYRALHGLVPLFLFYQRDNIKF